MKLNKCKCRTEFIASLLLLLIIALAGCSAATVTATDSASAAGTGSNGSIWSVTQNGNILQIAYGSGNYFPQYGALDLTSSYLRLVYGPSSGWGTSIILLPSFWSQSSCQPDPCQGAPVTATQQIKGVNLVLTITGTIGGLHVTSIVTLSPPTTNSITANVKTTTTGQVKLDHRPGEAFKPVMLSSMHDSSTQWDTQQAYAGSQTFSIPASGWIVHPPVNALNFGLVGGTSSWKTNAPTIAIVLNQSRQVTGWVTQDSNPNDDNVGYWCATNKVLSSWSFNATAEPGPS
jgi:hypothetical protein